MRRIIASEFSHINYEGELTEALSNWAQEKGCQYDIDPLLVYGFIDLMGRHRKADGSLYFLSDVEKILGALNHA